MPLLSFYQEELLEAGCDEAGRGCLAGPVFAAAVILPKKYTHPVLNDSKQLSADQREDLRVEIESHAVCYAVVAVETDEIDELNILQASITGMHRAVRQLPTRPGLLLIDGNRFKPIEATRHVCIIKGDAKYYSIAAASVLAKTYRDRYMEGIHAQFPIYNWRRNKGYPTLQHRRAIEQHGHCRHHRKSFRVEAWANDTHYLNA